MQADLPLDPAPGRWRARAPLLLASCLALLMALAPLFTHDGFILQVLFKTLLFGALGASWSLVGGFLGRISFGHGFFLGVGAYTTVLLMLDLHVSPLLGIPLGGLAAAAVAWLIAAPTLRLSGHYFAMITIGLLQIGLLGTTNLSWAGGASGLSVPIGDHPWMLLFRNRMPYYLIAVALALLSFAAVYFSTRSRLGYYWRAISGDEAAARSLGVSAQRCKLLGFALSAALTGVWGGFFAIYVGFIDPDSMFSLSTSVEIVLVAILGGAGSLYGPWLGAALLIPLGEITRAAWGGSSGGADVLVYGLVIVAVTMFIPGGLTTLRRRHGLARG
jgi:branched-chain amino acid transport system permease protein